MTESYVSRQPIFDRQAHTVGYDLLFRTPSDEGPAVVTQTDAARAIVATLADIGLDSLVGDTRAFLRAGRNLLVNGDIRACPADRVVIEVLETAADDQEVIAAVRTLAREGYEFTLSNFALDAPLSPLLELANLVKIDVTRYSDEELAARLRLLAPFPRLLALAEKVETLEQYERCYRLGFDFFQGTFFAVPQIRQGRVIGADKATRLQIIASLQNPNVDPARLEALVSQDLGLSHRVLLFVNSAYAAMPRRIHSVREAIVLLGYGRLKLFATLVTLADSTDRPRELLVNALVRARMCEVLAPAIDVDPDSAFTVGLFSAADALLGISMSDLVERLPLADDTKAALLDREGPLGELLQVALTYERGSLVLASPVSIPRCRAAYIDAVAWSAQIGRLSAPTSPARAA